MPFLQRSFDATHATARKITTWLAPSSVLLQLGSTASTPPPAAAAAPGQHFGHHGPPGHSHHPHAAHVPSHQHPGSAGPLPSAAMIGLGTTSLSPHVFHSGTAEGPAGSSTGGGVSGGASSSNRTAGSFHLHHQHQQPPSPLHHRHSQGSIGGRDFLYGLGGEGASGLGGFKSPAEAAALLLCHSALNTTWIHLNNARKTIPPSAMAQGSGARGGGSGEFYRPPLPQQSRPSSASSMHAAPDVPRSAVAMYPHHPHTQQLAHQPTPQPYHHQQHPVYSPYSSTAQPSSLSIPPAAPGPNNGVPSATGSSPWTAWPESDPSLVGMEADIPPWINTTSAVPGASDSRSFQAPYAQRAPQQLQYTFQTSQIPSQRYPPQPSPVTPIDPVDTDPSGKSSLVAAREIADLASTAVALPAIFDELDMTIGVRKFVNMGLNILLTRCSHRSLGLLRRKCFQMRFTAERTCIQEIIEAEAEVDMILLLATTRRPIFISSQYQANSLHITIQQLAISLHHHRSSILVLRHTPHISEGLPEKRTMWIPLFPSGKNGTSSCTRSIG